ncbi:MAG: LTA synthase family protein [Anaerovoracaceae bacterium]
MGSLPKEIKYFTKIAAIWIFVLVLVLNPFNSTFIMSLNNQEFFSYHLKDIIETLSTPKSQNTKEFHLATGTYESEKDGELFGIAKDKNLIVIQMESMQNILIGRNYNGQEITPNLNRLIKEQGTIYFDNFYQQIGSGNTSDAEFAINNSLLGSIESFTYQLYQDNYFHGLPWVLKDAGYQTAVFHGYDKKFWNRERIYPVLGFDTFINSDILIDDKIEGIGGGNIVGISDQAFFKQSAEFLEELNAGGCPFYSFLITLSCHHPFRLPDFLKGLDLYPQDENNIVGNYLNAAHYADRAIGEFLELLKEKGLYQNSVIALYGDHFGLPKSDRAVDERVTELLGYEYDYDVMLNVPLIIHIPEYEGNMTVSTSGGQLDFMPTICYLLGIEELNTLYLGQNLFTAESGFAPGQTHLLKGSFIKDDIVFEISRDGVFENSRAYNRITRKGLDITDLRDEYLRAKSIVELSDFYLKNDVLRSVILEGKTIEGVIDELNSPKSLPSRLTLLDPSLYSSAQAEKGERSFVSVVNWMRDNEEEKTAIIMDDMLDWLQNMDDYFTGSVKKGVVRSINTERDAILRDLKSRMIPVIRTMDDCTKIEYLGYKDILFMPNFEKYTRKQIMDFIEMNRPCAVAIPAEKSTEQFNSLISSDIFVYVYGVSDPVLRSLLSAIGVDGFIEREVLEVK